MFKFRTAARQWPIEAGTWNHRAAAVYRAAEEDVEGVNPNVQSVLKRGLLNVRLVHPLIPPRVWQRFIVTHNLFHTGSGSNFVDFIEDSLRLESEWDLHCGATGIHSQNPKYKSIYKDFVLAKSSSAAY